MESSRNMSILMRNLIPNLAKDRKEKRVIELEKFSRNIIHMPKHQKNRNVNKL